MRHASYAIGDPNQFLLMVGRCDSICPRDERPQSDLIGGTDTSLSDGKNTAIKAA